MPESDLPEDEENQQRLREIGERMGEKFEEEYPDYDGAQWSWDWQGAGTIPSERSEETLQLFRDYYAALTTEKHMTDDRLWREHSADVRGLDFDERLVEAFIRIVKEFQRVLEPRRSRPPAAQHRLDRLHPRGAGPARRRPPANPRRDGREPSATSRSSTR